MATDNTKGRQPGTVFDVRRATAADAGALVNLATRFYREEGFSEDALAALQQTAPEVIRRADTVAYLAIAEGLTVGMATASTSYGLEVGLYAELEDLYVLPAFRSHGVAGALVDAVVAWAGSQGCHDLEVVLTPQAQANQALLDWYDRRGFRKTGRIILERELPSGPAE